MSQSRTSQIWYNLDDLLRSLKRSFLFFIYIFLFIYIFPVFYVYIFSRNEKIPFFAALEQKLQNLNICPHIVHNNFLFDHNNFWYTNFNPGITNTIQPLPNRRPTLCPIFSTGLPDSITPFCLPPTHHPIFWTTINPYGLPQFPVYYRIFPGEWVRRWSSPCIMGCGWTCDSKNWAFAASDSPRARLSGDNSRTSPGNNLISPPLPSSNERDRVFNFLILW